MKFIRTLEQLESLYDEPAETAIRKVARRITPEYRSWIARSRFCILSTVGPDGTDASPRGDDGPVVLEIDDQTLAMPDWFGNNRTDSLRNIVFDPRISLLFMVAGSNNVVRVNGAGRITVDAQMIARFTKKGRAPRCIILFGIDEIYFQCARALLRAGLWANGDQSQGLPSAGEILAAMTDGQVGGETYDTQWSGRALKTLW